MHSLRQARFLARLVLAWFVLSLGAAVASPLVNPVNFEVVCASTGTGAMKLVVKNGGGDSEQRSMFDCPLCTGTAAAPPRAVIASAFDVPLGHVFQPILAAHIATLGFASVPARGPPHIALS